MEVKPFSCFKFLPSSHLWPSWEEFLLLKTPMITLGSARWFQTTSTFHGPYSTYMLTFRRIRVVASLGGGGRGAYCAYHITISLSSRYFPFLPSPWLLNQGKYLAHEQFKPYHRAVARHMRGWEKFDNHRHWSRLMGQSYKIKIGRKERSRGVDKDGVFMSRGEWFGRSCTSKSWPLH